MAYRIKLIVLYLIGAAELIACFDCPRPTGTFEDPTDPRKFYECFDNRAFRSTCAANLVFDAELGQCNFEYDVHHNTTTTDSSTDSKQTVFISTQSPATASTGLFITETLSIQTTEPPTPPPTTTPPPTSPLTESPTQPPTILTEAPTQPPTDPPTTTTTTTTSTTTTTTTEPTTVTTTPTTTTITTPIAEITTETTTLPPEVTTQNPNWETFKTKMDGEMNHLSQYMTSVLRDAQMLIKDNKEESMRLMMASIIKEIGVIIDLENQIKAELKENLTAEAKAYLEKTEQTLTSDKEKLNQLLIELQRALDAQS